MHQLVHPAIDYQKRNQHLLIFGQKVSHITKKALHLHEVLNLRGGR